MQPSRRLPRWLIWTAALLLGFAMGGLLYTFLLHQAFVRDQTFRIHHHMLSPELRDRLSVPEHHKRVPQGSGLKRTGPAVPAGLPPKST